MCKRGSIEIFGFGRAILTARLVRYQRLIFFPLVSHGSLSVCTTNDTIGLSFSSEAIGYWTIQHPRFSRSNVIMFAKNSAIVFIVKKKKLCNCF